MDFSLKMKIVIIAYWQVAYLAIMLLVMFSKLFQDFVSNIQKFLKRVFTNEKICVKIRTRKNISKERSYGI